MVFLFSCFGRKGWAALGTIQSIIASNGLHDFCIKLNKLYVKNELHMQMQGLTNVHNYEIWEPLGIHEWVYIYIISTGG